VHWICKKWQGKKKSDKISLIRLQPNFPKFGGPMAERNRGDCESKSHIEIGHFSEKHTFTEVKWIYFWHDSMEFVKRVIFHNTFVNFFLTIS
jgi:hypothetical protein